jgi:hypothetical protein
MDPDGVFPAEMPERGPAPTGALDDNTVERLVRGRMGPDDAPPGYAGVARVLQAAGGPAGPDELAGREPALAMFRAHGPTGDRGRAGSQTRGRLVALALAGVLAAGGLWTAAAAPSRPGLPSRAGAPQSGGSGSGAPGSVTQARPMTPPVTGAGANARAPVRPPARERSTRNGGGVAASRTSAHGSKEHRPGKPPKPKPEKPKPRTSRSPSTSGSRTARPYRSGQRPDSLIAGPPGAGARSAGRPVHDPTTSTT